PVCNSHTPRQAVPRPYSNRPTGPRTIINTGSRREIVRAVAADLAATTGTELVLVSRTATCEAVAAACNQRRPGAARALRIDLGAWDRDRAPLDALIAAAPGPIALVHAAGVLGPTGPFADNDLGAWFAALEVNLGGAIRLT